VRFKLRLEDGKSAFAQFGPPNHTVRTHFISEKTFAMNVIAPACAARGFSFEMEASIYNFRVHNRGQLAELVLAAYMHVSIWANTYEHVRGSQLGRGDSPTCTQGGACTPLRPARSNKSLSSNIPLLPHLKPFQRKRT